MAVNTTLAGLSQTAASNGPDGGADPPSALDDALRYHGAFIAMLRDAAAPVGGIIMYSGLAADLTANWKICDGTAGTPDLRDKFIVGSGSAYALAATGGSKDAIVVSHSHTLSGNTSTESATHSHAVSDPGHSHTGGEYGGVNNFAPGGLGTQARFAGAPGAFSTDSATTGITLGTESATHTHALSGSTSTAGAAATNANLPPYYALAFIQRVS